jgi:radical SAM-linked protein
VKLRLRHTKLGKIRFTSHRDTARHWERAVRKAQVPLAYSAGFTPRPRMSFGLALPTGAESLAEYLDMELAPEAGPDIDLADLAVRFSAELPVGYEVTHVVARDADSVPSLQEDVVACTWVLTLEGIDAHELRDTIERTLAVPSLMVDRERKGQRSTDDVRPAILDLSVAPATDDPRPHLCAMLATNGRGLRPVELLAAMFPALDPVDTAAKVLRTQQWIERDGMRREIIPAVPFATRTPVECA